MTQRRLTIEEIYKNAFGDKLDGLKSDQRQFAQQSFAAYGPNFENAPDRKSDVSSFNRMLDGRLDDNQKKTLQARTKPLADKHTDSRYRDTAGSDIVTGMLDALCWSVVFSDPVYIPAPSGGVGSGLAETAADAIADAAVESATDAGGGVLESIGDVVGGILDFTP